MVQLKLLSGKMAGTVMVARHFPFRIGRAPAMDLRLEEDGVWDQHLELDFDREQGFVLKTQGSALASVNGQSLPEFLLRSGDLIEFGAVRIYFWLGETRQSSLRFREWLVWAGFALMVALQVYLIQWLMR
jgi:hypothetical protein